jgi:hypothetical protein
MKPLTRSAHVGPRHSPDRRPIVASHSGVALRNYTSIVEGQLARIDQNRATLEALAETYGTTPVQAAVEEILNGLRAVAVALLPAARAANAEFKEKPQCR